MEKKRIVLLGGTRGFGFELAREFVSLGADIVITGRHLADAEEAARKITHTSTSGSRVFGREADIEYYPSLASLHSEACALLGSIDILIVNAGISQPPAKAWEADVADIDRVLSTDLRGPMYAVRAFMPAMISAGQGSIWFIEGLGSNGMIVDRFSLYGTSKRGLAYYWRALAKEARGTGVTVCALSPGMMITDFLMGNLDREDAAKRDETIKLYNILADRPESVARFAAPRILANARSGRLIQWLTTPKVAFRFLSAPFSRRDVVSR